MGHLSWMSLFPLVALLLLIGGSRGQVLSDSGVRGHRGHSDIEVNNVGIVFDDEENNVDMPMMTEGGESKPATDSCENSQYGCCRDGKTHAPGPERSGCPENNLVGGCAGTRHGCCRDGRSYASGPEKQGCPETNLVGGCAGTRHGCCRDGRSYASGPGKQGCPETTLVGGCAGTRHGCCRDGRTSARGENRFGCPETNIYPGGCSGTRYGCCNDRVTAARGDRKLGCPENPIVTCHMTQFGCCEDKETAATGPDAEGCPESETSAATGGCKAARYGCCPDNMTPAGGLNNEGCPSFDTAFCGLEKHPGNCSEYALQWYFETKYGMCRQFWYGGCGGNQNRFTTKDDCQDKCVNVTGPAQCRLPKVTGPCRASKTRFFYNARSGKCETFTYGGCKANSNNFLTISQCEVTCNGAVSTEPRNREEERSACSSNPCQYGFECRDRSDRSYECGCNPDWGQSCSQIPNYWCFDDSECESGFKCIRQKHCRDEHCYVYARCSVPSSKYTCDRERCPSNQDCVNDSGRSQGYFCVDKVKHERTHNVVLGCRIHEFGCCPDGKTAASGPQYAGCSDDCMYTEHGCCPDEKTRATGPDYGGCELEGSAEMPCDKTDYGCCDDGIRAATGPRGQGCQDTTDAETTETTVIDNSRRRGMVKCTADTSRQLCDKYVVKWRYDSKLKACERHWWGGCQDNGNVFDTEPECEAECISGTIVEPEPTDDPDFFNICDMPSVVGACRGRMPRYFYDPRDRNCKMFTYSGCGGNENNFNTMDECQKECMADIRRPVTPAPTPRPTAAPKEEATLVMSGPSVVQVGSELRVTCVTTGPLGLRLEWFFNGQPVTGENVEITFDRKRHQGGIKATGALIIDRASQENSGTYYCRNSEMETKSMSVNVESRREATTAPTEREVFASSMTLSGPSVVYEGSQLKITCQARGPSDVGLEWFINGQAVTDNDDIEVKSDLKRVQGGYEIIGDLIIARAQMQNGGTYYCRSADKQIESMIVTVRRRNEVTPRPTERPTPRPTRKPDGPVSASSITMMGDARVPRGNTLTVTCRAEGPRRPTSIEWFINGRFVNPKASIASITNTRDPRSNNALIGTFAISNVNYSNDGTYYCRSRPYGDIGRMSIKINNGVAPPTEAPVIDTTTTTTTTEASVKASPADVCKMDSEAGNCYASIPRWYYDHQDGICKNMMYGGCNGNENNFMTEQECNGFCGAEEICLQQKVIGRCRASLPRFYFDTTTRKCENFFYGGCGANVNNFATLEACERKCAAYIEEEDTTNVDIGDKEEEEDVCELGPEKGSCRGYNIKWYYSASRNRCTRFVYTGCDGNGNQFETEDECNNKCIRTDKINPTWRPTRRPRPRTLPATRPASTTPMPPTRPITTAATTTQSNVISREYSCEQPSDYGPCHDYKIKWYYNAEDLRCLRFYYGGCGGNNNRFETRLECENICVRGIVPTEATTPRPTERPRPNQCVYSRYGCCNDGYTTATDRALSNCQENRGGSGNDFSSVLVPIGTDATLECPVRTGEVSWYRDGFLLRSDRRFHIYENGTLNVRRVSSDMAGNYACRVAQGNNIPQLYRFKININEPLSIVPGPVLASVKPGEAAFLHCQALGNPQPQIQWLKDGRVIRSGAHHNVFPNGTLIITGTNFADEGQYVCSADNGVSEPAERVITLNLKETIEADILNHKGIYLEGDTITLKCKGEGFPPPTIEWEKEGNVIKASNRVTVEGENLMVRSASIEDAGMYKCTASNERAADTDYTTVQIKLQTPKDNCEDTMRRSKCHLIVTGRLCGFRMFANKCCESCRRAGYV